MKAVKVRITKGGWAVIPSEFLETFGLCLEEDLLRDQSEELSLQEIQESYWDDVGLKESLSDADWVVIEEAGKDRCV